ncbi:MAG: putative oxidoreductase SadH [Firmicutes bacterium ADurb.Bin300]|jgi:short-subunit dehydrogenase|nr:MAG: putative oxidoreductase SadH [Firmicutes bacterium ADurb.Bin300]HOD02170.1 SDR family NAD(P)-dependent oxidoreductase [Clostridiales bacterium]
MYSLERKVLIVTGAGSGMGREMTLQLINKGVKVAACDINEKTLEETKTLVSNPKLIKTYVLNVADKESVLSFPKTVKEDFGALHGVINNAGIIQPFVKFMELPEASIERVMNINFFGLMNLTRAVINELNTDTDTFIVNVSSMGGFLPVPGQGIYGASKAAVKLFTEALYAEMQGTRVHVSVVFPGAVATNISENSMGNNAAANSENKKSAQQNSEASYKTTSADVAAEIIINGIEAGKVKIFVGKDAVMMDRMYRLMPVKSINMMAKMINKMTAQK